jgi:hypothetical protein
MASGMSSASGDHHHQPCRRSAGESHAESEEEDLSLDGVELSASVVFPSFDNTDYGKIFIPDGGTSKSEVEKENRAIKQNPDVVVDFVLQTRGPMEAEEPGPGEKEMTTEASCSDKTVPTDETLSECIFYRHVYVTLITGGSMFPVLVSAFHFERVTLNRVQWHPT